MPAVRCPWAVRFGVILHTRCQRPAGHPGREHEGPGLAQFPYQRVSWLDGDRRAYRDADHADATAAWEGDPPAELHGGRCAAQHLASGTYTAPGGYTAGRWVQCALVPGHLGPHLWGDDNQVTEAVPFA